jgi:glutamate--cysteine ligase
MQGALTPRNEPHVTTPRSTLDEPIRSYDDLFVPFASAEKPASEFRIGAEMEKCGVDGTAASPLPYDGDRGVVRILRYLAEEHGWVPERESEDGPLIALLRNGASITLEPGAQLELSGAPLEDVHQICAEFGAHLRELEPISRELGIVWLGLGFHPFARREDLSWVPKMRYGIMRTYLPTRGGHALDMMLRTCTVQANYDFTSEADAMRKLTVSLRLSAVTTALFANSPWLEGNAHGGPSFRAKVWLDVDPDRSGLVPTVWKPGAGYREYIEWALDVPMFMVKRGGKKLVNTGQTFRSFWKDGFEGERPTQNDWQTHLNTLFPEVRLKKTIEVRGADAQGRSYACALPALWTGIFYDERALAEAEALVADYTFEEVEASRAHVGALGLRAPFRGKTLQPIAEQVIAIAEGGLERRARKNARGADERVHLAKLKALVARGMTPGDELLDGFSRAEDPRAYILERTNMLAVG